MTSTATQDFALQGLRDRQMAKSKRPPKPKATPHITDLMFRDTITARMLRTLCFRGEMTQADFMNLYHERCDRPRKDSFSSFGNNFGRFVRLEQTHRGWVAAAGPYRCVSQARPRLIPGPGVSRDNILTWNYQMGEVQNVHAMLAWMSADQLYRAEQWLEFHLTDTFDTVGDEAEHQAWLVMVRDALQARSS